MIYWIVAINGVGLALGIAGAWSIWRNGLPPTDIAHDVLALESSPDPDVIEKRKADHVTKSKRGMLFLVIGFTFQFVGNLLTVFQ